MTEQKKDEVAKLDPNTLVKPKKFGLTGIHARMEQAVKQAVQDEVVEATLPNRVSLMLDCSGSMSEYVGDKLTTRIRLLRDAVESFVNNVDTRDTAFSIDTFPQETLSVPMTSNKALGLLELDAIDAGGGTEMGNCMDYVLNTQPLTHGIIVSDGEATDDPFRPAKLYKEAGVAIDCVHIGEGANGEETLKTIASITGGLYIKFKDVNSFAKAFKFLTPAYRGLLESPDAAKLLGADEVK